MGSESRQMVEGFLSQNSFVSVNKKLLRVVGDCTTAVVLGELMSLSQYFRESGKTKDDWFFMRGESLIRELGISDYLQRKAVSNLEDMGFLESKVRGSPPVRYLKLNYKAIWKAVEQEAVTKVSAKAGKSKKAQSKKDFYEWLNVGMTKKYEKAVECFGNIPQMIGEFMYAWSQCHQFFAGKQFEWTSKEYGAIAPYLKGFYGGPKGIDYRNLFRYFNTDQNPEYALYDFITVDRLATEA